ncbi:MAG: sigma-70 family RNA polymerase sigma factor [Actinomycetia bacterium]|nr:sigma-70 family RNA polymerase sigma factor [Actinomycetes bacterium]MCP5035438.1 sigma-70 family RNA polymerase sigma factor [Actinomycetes bacterium]
MTSLPNGCKQTAAIAAPDLTFTELVASALDGDAIAWESLVDRLSRVAWKTISNYRLSAADREDAFASTFYRLYDKLHTVRQPEALPGWIATTARNEVHSMLRSQGRLIPMETLPLRQVTVDEVDERLLDDELTAAVLEAFATLPAKGQALLRALTAVPPLSYETIGRLLDMPVGSIGPMRGSYLRQLRAALGPWLDGEGQ